MNETRPELFCPACRKGAELQEEHETMNHACCVHCRTNITIRDEDIKDQIKEPFDWRHNRILRINEIYKRWSRNDWNSRHNPWISVRDTLPREGQAVLTWHIEDLYPVIGFYVDKDEPYWVHQENGPEDGDHHDYKQFYRPPTHWAPLDALPEPE